MVNVEELIGKIRGMKKPALPIVEYKLNYDAFAETLEPVYFWILDFMKDHYGLGMKVEKLVDNFVASPGSGYFADLGMRATRMQEQGMKILGTINTVMRSILNLVYDLKEFEIRLEHYDKFESKNHKDNEAALLTLKQIWMDKVDIKRGAGSINLLTQQLDFVTLRDAFMKAAKPEDIDKIDLNERVKRILKPRIAEFRDWVKRSEKELRSRYNLQKTYLKSQVSALKLYTRWVKPYLKAAEELTMKVGNQTESSIVTSFNTMVLELLIFGKSKIDIGSVRKAIGAREFPRQFWNVKLRQSMYTCLFVDFSFRGMPRIASRAESTHYVHSGKAYVKFKAYVLSDDEIAMLKKEIEKQDIYEGLRLVEGVTTDTLLPIHDDLMKYLEDKPKEKPKAKGIFDALLGTPAKKKEAKLRGETFIEKQIRKLIAEPEIKGGAWRMYHIYKKAHDMATPLTEFVSKPGE